MGEKCSDKFRLRIRLPRNPRDLLHAANLRHGTDGFTSPPKEGVLRIFSPLKIRLLRPGLNSRTWVPKASTLPLDHRSYLYSVCSKNTNILRDPNRSHPDEACCTCCTARHSLMMAAVLIYVINCVVSSAYVDCQLVLQGVRNAQFFAPVRTTV